MKERGIKVSVWVDDGLHQQLRIKSIQEHMTLQAIMTRCALRVIESQGSSTDVTFPSPREIRRRQAQLNRLLRSGDSLVVNATVAIVEAFHALVAVRSSTQPPGLPR